MHTRSGYINITETLLKNGSKIVQNNQTFFDGAWTDISILFL